MIKKILTFLVFTILLCSCFVIPKKDYYTNYRKNGKNLTKGKNSCNMFPYPLKEFKRSRY